MSDANRKNKLSVLLMASLITTNLVFAGDAYKNNVVDVKVNKESNNAVKVTIYTDKPYTEPVVVNKKANNKYVILMPETKSSLKSTPSVSNVSGTVSNVSVNTQAVSGGKGYTKIIITSEKAITVVPHTQQLSTTKQHTQSAISAQQKAQQEAKAKQVAAQKAAQQKAQQEAKAKHVAQSTNKTQPIDILEQEIKTDKNAQYSTNTNDEILNQEIKENTENNKNKQIKKKKPAIQEMNDDKLSVLQNIKAVIKDYQNINLWKLLLLASAITFPVIVIMIILGLDKRINKRIKQSFKREDEYNYNPTPTNNNIENVQQNQSPSFNSFEEMLNKVDEQTPTFHEEQLHKAQYEKFEQSVQDMQSIQSQINKNEVTTNSNNEDIEPIEPEIVSDEQFNNDFENDDFKHDFDNSEEDIEEIPQVNTPEEVTKEESSKEVKPEPKQEPLVPIAPTETEKPVQQVPQTSYTPDGYLSDFANVNDKDFFDELVIQSMAENNTNGLPEETPADEIFNYITDETKQKNETNVNVKPEVTTPTQKEVSEISQIESTPVNSIQQTNTDVQQNDNNDVKEPQQDTTNIEVQSNEQENNDDLTMLTEAKINDSTGLYLVNYENFSSLVGHINDDYFVIKKFDDIVNGNIILKQTEKLKDATRYLVRIGRNKMVIEVTPTSMNRLLDL